MIDGGAQGPKLEETYKEIAEAYNTLERAQEELMLIIEDVDMDAESGYLDNPSQSLYQMDIRVHQAVENKNKVANDLQKEQEKQQKLVEKQQNLS